MSESAASTNAVTLKVSAARWAWAVGMDSLLLLLLWAEYLWPRDTAFALGSLLTLLFTVNAWAPLLRRLGLQWQVRRVFGDSIRLFQPGVWPWTYRCVSILGDVLIAATLLWTQQWALATAYGMAALLIQALLMRSAFTS